TRNDEQRIVEFLSYALFELAVGCEGQQHSGESPRLGGSHSFTVRQNCNQMVNTTLTNWKYSLIKGKRGPLQLPLTSCLAKGPARLGQTRTDRERSAPGIRRACWHASAGSSRRPG